MASEDLFTASKKKVPMVADLDESKAEFELRSLIDEIEDRVEELEQAKDVPIELLQSQVSV